MLPPCTATWLGAFGGHTPSAARCLGFGFLHLLFNFLVPSFPAVRNLGQQLTSTLNIAVSPKVQRHAATFDHFRSRKFAGLNVSAESSRLQTEFLCRFTCRKHFCPSVTDTFAA